MYVNVIQLAESLGVEESVVEGWVRNEGLPCIRDSGRMLFDRNQVASWAAERGLAARAGFLAPNAAGPASARLEALLKTGGVWRDVDPSEVLRTLEQILLTLSGASPAITRMLGQRIYNPDAINWAPVGHGFALPHLRARVSLGRDSGLLALLFLKSPLPFSEPPPDGVQVDKLLFFVAPTPRAHLEMLAQLSFALRSSTLREQLRSTTPDAELLDLLRSAGEGRAV